MFSLGTATPGMEPFVRRKERFMNTKDMSRCFLSVERGKQQGQIYELHQEVVRIGRSSKNDFLLDDPTVSLLHARVVRLRESAYGIQDMRSANGTFLNSHIW